tara:strand:- start:817 stop:939 length:123 start_codon:yes stop_codon:yes gene_type:complete
MSEKEVRTKVVIRESVGRLKPPTESKAKEIPPPPPKDEKK